MQFPPHYLSVHDRMLMTVSCRDADYIPKVPNAGLIIEDSDQQPVQIMHNGVKIVPDCYYGSWMTELIKRLRGHHEPQEEAVFHEVVRRLPPNANMLELGGFWAYYSLWFLKDHPGRRSLVLEPDPNHLEAGRRNAELNGLEPTFLQGFAGSHFEQATPFWTESAGELVLPRYSVEHLMQAQRWNRLDLLHVDIQGAELDVLSSCEQLFRRGLIDWVFVSTHSHWISGDPLTHQKCLGLLQDYGAAIEVEHDVHESFSGDGLIVARFCPPPMDWSKIELSYNRQSTSHFRHLAFELAEKNIELAEKNSRITSLQELVQRQQPSSLNPHLKARGALLTLSSECPLGHAGDSLIVMDDNVIGASCRAHASWDIDGVREFCSLIPSDGAFTLVDVGANIGLFTRQLCMLSDRISRVVCVEPDPLNFRALRYNLAFLEAKAELHNVALAAKDGTEEFFQDLENTGNYSLNQSAMRNRPFETAAVTTRATADWAGTALKGRGPLLWKSDTQGSDELIVSQIPMDIWNQVDVAMLELWRIAKPAYDRAAFRERLSAFPNRKLGNSSRASVDDICDYLNGGDLDFKDLLLWRDRSPAETAPRSAGLLGRLLGKFS